MGRFGRFGVRRTDRGYGVVDGSLNGLRSADDLTEDVAHEKANQLEIQYGAYGPRDASTVRRLDTPQPVDVAQWQPGAVLEVWVQEGAEWWGLVRDEAGRSSWHPASELRPAKRR
ncbi:MAG TPA: hypothetical protein VGJ44_27115 [Kribbellaceae bacterium]